MSPVCCVEQKVVVGGQKKLHVFLSEAIGCFFPFFGQCGSREREPCNVPSPYPPWHITYVMCRTILFPGTSHVQCANTLRSEAHDICYVPSLVPPWHITWFALARGSVTPNGAPVVGGGGVRQHNGISTFFPHPQFVILNSRKTSTSRSTCNSRGTCSTTTNAPFSDLFLQKPPKCRSRICKCWLSSSPRNISQPSFAFSKATRTRKPTSKSSEAAGYSRS